MCQVRPCSPGRRRGTEGWTNAEEHRTEIRGREMRGGGGGVGPAILRTKPLPGRGACVAGTPQCGGPTPEGLGSDLGDLGKSRARLSCHGEVAVGGELRGWREAWGWLRSMGGQGGPAHLDGEMWGGEVLERPVCSAPGPPQALPICTGRDPARSTPGPPRLDGSCLQGQCGGLNLWLPSHGLSGCAVQKKWAPGA